MSRSTMAGQIVTRRTVLAMSAGALCLPAWSALAGSRDKNPWAPLDALCAQLLADRVAPGLAVSVMRAGRLVYSSGFGLANLETGARVTPRTAFRIGSITKQFTAAAVMLLAEDGKLAVDDQLARFLPEFPRAAEVTLRQMLTHTSGLGNYTDTESRAAFYQAARTDYDDHALYLAMRGTSPLFVAPPGTRWEYSNTAYVLLGMVVEKASGVTYPEFLKSRIFGPAGLADTAVDDAAAVVAGRASGYTPDAKAPSGFDNASFISMTFPGGAGSLRSTTEDLCRWHHALLGGRVVRPDSLAVMTTPGRLLDGTLPTEPPDPEHPGPSKPLEYGFGLDLGTFDGHRLVGHGGGINGFASQLRSFPEQQLSVATLINCDFAENPEGYAASESVRDAAVRIGLALG